MLVAADRLSVFPEGKILVLAPTRPLVVQHAEFFKDHFPDREARSVVLTGETPAPMRESAFDESTLVFATPEVIRNDVSSGRYDLARLSLTLFYTPHKSATNYPYPTIPH